MYPPLSYTTSLIFFSKARFAINVPTSLAAALFECFVVTSFDTSNYTICIFKMQQKYKSFLKISQLRFGEL